MNTGERAGSTVVQVYASRRGSAIDRPVRWLVGFAKVRLAAGARQRVEIELPARRFAHWDDGWRCEPGEFLVEVGFSSADLRGSAVVAMGDAARSA